MFQELSGILLPTPNSALKIHVMVTFWLFFLFVCFLGFFGFGFFCLFFCLETSKLPRHLLHSIQQQCVQLTQPPQEPTVACPVILSSLSCLQQLYFRISLV